MKVKTFAGGFCSQKFFARVIGRSATQIYFLRLMGIVKYCAAGVIVFQSLRAYFNSYLPPNKRREELTAAVARIKTFDAAQEYSAIESARALQKKIDAAEMKLTLLKFFNRLDARAVPANLLSTSTQELLHLRRELITVKEKIRREIISAELPPAVENVLLRRYVDCEKWKEITESVYSLSYNYTLHRRGRNFF